MATWHVRKTFTQVKQQLSSAILLHLWKEGQQGSWPGLLLLVARNAHYTNPGRAIHKAIFDQHPPEVVQLGSPALAALNLVCDSSPTTVIGPEDTWPKRANQMLAVWTRNWEAQRSLPGRASEETGDLGPRRHRLPRQKKPKMKAHRERWRVHGALRDSEKSPIFAFPRISSDPVILFCPWFLRDFCVSFPQTPLCYCWRRRNTESSSRFWFWSGGVGMLSWPQPSPELHGNKCLGQLRWHHCLE